MSEIFRKLALLGDVWVLWLLLGASVLSVAVIAGRWRAFRKEKLDFPAFLDGLSALLERGAVEEARGFAAKSEAVEARVALSGLEMAGRGPASAEEAMLSRLVIERGKLERGLIVLGTLGNNAPFLGLFGTVLGIIKAFNDLALSGASGVSVVMSGISSALIATAFGIFVAIPAVAANNVFHTRLKRRCANAQSVIHLIQSYLRDARGCAGCPTAERL
ncbi:MAG: MotA/TolQ/ExbB proton channel family protein [Elusimicrobia bacterium]|nr:MotA/TolQ/ExbB proton channel family protein [Elusimicrobiota bacterium]